ncbi:Transposase OS=Streptomyces griseomycini OX=66895 GN=FHS37_007740 PE=4 SV=1 [Streptomyces griseomycini]|uniref:Uncharacterized protein n=1 Tax=Streptomyces griseomycini TaxID=66895 RepID=A0A7W7VB20_9ACTN|nr:hypothetical protein [Streptomyces griseomycini]GGR59452.1 hypothetical protein GCM10015536_74800 [Streptomyces griseomycini]
MRRDVIGRPIPERAGSGRDPMVVPIPPSLPLERLQYLQQLADAFRLRAALFKAVSW